MGHPDRTSAIPFKSPTVTSEYRKAHAEQLRNVELFRGLTKSQRVSILRTGTWHHREAGTLFYRQGDPVSRLNLLVSGRVKIYSVTPQGSGVHLGFIVPEVSFGFGALVIGNTRITSAEAVMDSEVVAWDNETLTRLMETHPRFAINAFVTAESRVLRLIERLEERVTANVRSRIAKTLVRLADQIGMKSNGRVIINGNFQLKDLAELAGTTIYTVSRVLGGWAREGIVEKHRHSLVLSNTAKLDRLAGVIGMVPGRLPNAP